MSRRGRQFLDDNAFATTCTVDTVEKSGRRYGVAILTRGGPELSSVSVSPPEFVCREGMYAERALAVNVKCDGDEWTVLGVHLPNSVTRNGAADHSYKEECFGALGSWVEQHRDTRLVVGIDANRSESSRFPPSRPAEKSKVAEDFLLNLKKRGLRDAVMETWKSGVRPATHWTPNPQYFDRLLVSDSVRVSEARIVQGVAGPGSKKLSDHAPVFAALT